jgi:hypothetical protein
MPEVTGEKYKQQDERSKARAAAAPASTFLFFGGSLHAQIFCHRYKL